MSFELCLQRIAGNKLRHTLIDMPSCPICYEETSNPHFCVPCRHIFCYKCISAWKNRTCPLCRGNIASYRPIKLASFIENGTVKIDIQISKFYSGEYVLESHIFHVFIVLQSGFSLAWWHFILRKNEVNLWSKRFVI